MTYVTAAIACALTVWAVSMAAPTPARALDPVVESQISEVGEYHVRGGGATIPDATCGSVCADWWDQEHRPIPGQQTSEALHRDLRNWRTRTRVLPTIGSVVAGVVWIVLADEASDFAMKLGTKLVTLRVPAEGPGPAWTTQRFQPVEAGHPFMSFGNPWPTAPEDGFGWVWSDGYQTYWGRVDANNGCGGNHPDIPPEFHRTTVTDNWCYNDTAVSGGFLPETEVKASGPTVDYTGQPYVVEKPSWPGAPSTATEAQDRAWTQLGDSPLTEAYLCSQIDSQTCEPPQLESSRTQCDLNDAPHTDPAPERGTGGWPGEPGEFALRYEKVPTAQSLWPQDGVEPLVHPPGSDRVFLRYGFTRPSSNPYINWAGWGYRHIFAKHGWGPEEAAASIAALQDPTPLIRINLERGEAVTKYIYKGPEYTGRNDATCRRWVIVEYNQRNVEAEADQPAASMITSYGREM